MPQPYINRCRKTRKARNPEIAKILFLSGDIEKWGSGLKRIYGECKKNDVNVNFKVMNPGYSVEFARKPSALEKVTEKVTEKVGGKVTENQEKMREKYGVSAEEVRRKYGVSAEKVFLVIVENQFVKAREIALKTRLAQRTVEKTISRLKKSGVLKRVGPDKGGRWEVVVR